MALFRKLFIRKPPDGLSEICEGVYVFDSCYGTAILEDEEYKLYVRGIAGQLHNNFPEGSFVVFNFREGECQSQIAGLLSNYNMMVTDYPCQYGGCPLLPMEMIHHYLKSCENWLSLGQQNVVLMHCEEGGWPILAFMLAALLIFRMQSSDEQKTLEMLYKRAPCELLWLTSLVNPFPSQLRYLQYLSRRNIGSEWPLVGRALTLDCIILQFFPKMDEKGGCCPLFRIYGQDPHMVGHRAPKVLFSTSKKSKPVQYYKQVDCELKLDIYCHIQGDAVLECVSYNNDLQQEAMMFRVMFNTSFVRSNILLLSREEIDILWDAKDQFPKGFRAEVIFSEMDAANSHISANILPIEEKDGPAGETSIEVPESFSAADGLSPKAGIAPNKVQHLSASKFLLEDVDAIPSNSIEKAGIYLESDIEKVGEETIFKASKDKCMKPSLISMWKQSMPSIQQSLDAFRKMTELQDSQIAHQQPKEPRYSSKPSTDASTVRKKIEYVEPEAAPQPSTEYVHALRSSDMEECINQNKVFKELPVVEPRKYAPSFKPFSDETSNRKKIEPRQVHVALQLPAQSKLMSQSKVNTSISLPASNCSSLQGSPGPISRYHSAASVLGITALLHDHAASNKDATHPAQPISATSSSSALTTVLGPLHLSHVTNLSPPPPSPLLPPSLFQSSKQVIGESSLEKKASTTPSPPPPFPPSSESSSEAYVIKNAYAIPPPPPPPAPACCPPQTTLKYITTKCLQKTLHDESNFSSATSTPRAPPFSRSSEQVIGESSLEKIDSTTPPLQLSIQSSSEASVIKKASTIPPPPPPPPPPASACCPEITLKYITTKCLQKTLHGEGNLLSATPNPRAPSHLRSSLAEKNLSAALSPPPPSPPVGSSPSLLVKKASQAPFTCIEPPPPAPPSSSLFQVSPYSTPTRSSLASSPLSESASNSGSSSLYPQKSASPPLNSAPRTIPSAPPPPPPPKSSAKDCFSKNFTPAPSVPPALTPSKPGNVFSKTHSGASNCGAPAVPAMSSTTFNSKGQGTPRPCSKQQVQTKKANLRPYHWLKLTRATQGSLWAEAQHPDEASKAPEFDISELESLFSATVPTADNEIFARKSNRHLSGPGSEKVQLIQLRRAYNCEIMLSKVKIPLPELMSLVLALDESALDIDQVENLIKFCPSKEEMDLLKGYNGCEDNLGKCEQFFLELMKVPRVESKLRVFLFKLQFHSQVFELKRNLNVINSAVEEVKNSVKLKRVMHTILILGNALNHGTARGSAIGFRLDSLLKLTDTRARNNKMTLMHYLCKVLAEKLPELLDFPKDLVSLEAATKVQLKFLAEEMQAISKGIEKVLLELTASENDGYVSDVFRKTLREFLSTAEREAQSLASLYSIAGRNADLLALYFGEDPARCPFEQVVSTLLNFVRMFVQAHKENCKQLEFERKRGQKDAVNENEKVNFPRKYSEHLMQNLIRNKNIMC